MFSRLELLHLQGHHTTSVPDMAQCRDEENTDVNLQEPTRRVLYGEWVPEGITSSVSLPPVLLPVGAERKEENFVSKQIKGYALD